MTAYPKFFIGPMSKNVVDSIIQFSEEGIAVGLIPSRRQVEYSGGYVNNWTTGEFVKYVKGKSSNIVLERDHSGPLQGYEEDDGLESLEADAECGFDLIHIDPFKKHFHLEDALAETIDSIKFCNSINPKCFYEVGTEEAIRKYSPLQLDLFLNYLQHDIGELFEKVKFAVIQSGTKLKSGKNIANLDEERCRRMVDVCKKHGLLSKEHNGDYITESDIKTRFDIGLDAINIAPEFGGIETSCILQAIKEANKEDLFNTFYKLCYDSNRWRKWFPRDFSPENNKEQLIRVCGHYVFATSEFLDIKKQLLEIDHKICDQIKKKLKSLHSI
jgi:hypothetical protein